MVVWPLLVSAALLQLPMAELETLKGERLSGQLVAIDAAAITLQNGEARTQTPLAAVLELRIPSAAEMPELASPTGAELILHDGTRLRCSELSVTEGIVQMKSDVLGNLSLPLNAVANIRFGLSNSRLDEAWAGLLQRETRKDLLVLKKNEDVLDHLDGVIVDVGAKIRFLLDGDEIPVNREKVYGLIFTRRNTAAARKPVCEMRLAGGDVVQLASVNWDGTTFKGRLATGAEITVPLDKLRALDFSAGKIRYLSQMEPREVRYVPFFDITWTYRRDRNLDGGPLRLGGKTYSRGLCIHSRTYLKYRLAGEYSRFQAIMGIDQLVDRRGEVRVVISGDGKVLHESDVRGTDQPVPLDLDVRDVRDLEILVDFGPVFSDVSDHLDLADAKLLK